MSAEFAAIAGAKVELRPFAPEDLSDAYVGWLNDPEVTRFSNQRFRVHTRESCESYLAGFEGSANLFLSIRDLASDRAIGTMTAYRNGYHGTCDMGIMIGDRAYWGAGFGQEAWNLLANWLLKEAGVRKLTAGCVAPNGGMIRLMERSGMKREAVRLRQELVDGRAEDVVHYARFSD